MHLATSGLVYLQHGGMGFRFYQPIADALGGYALGAVLAFDAPVNPYCVMSTIPNNTINFNVERASIGDEWALVPKIQQYNPAFNFPRGYMLTYQDEAYVCVTANGPGAGGVVLPGTNESVWMQLLGAGGAPDTGRFFVGKIDLLPNRFSELPAGWYACYGTRYADYLPQGQALLSLSPTFRSDWGITLTADGINVPQLLTGANGYFLRAVNYSMLPWARVVPLTARRKLLSFEGEKIFQFAGISEGFFAIHRIQFGAARIHHGCRMY